MIPGLESGNIALLSMLTPLAATPLMLLLHRYPNWRETVSLGAGLVLLLLVIQLHSAGTTPLETTTLAAPVTGISIALAVEPLGLLFATLISILWLATTVYAIGYMRHHDESHQTRFYIWFAIAISSAIGIAFSANMFTLFVFYELLTFSTFPLVTHSGSREARLAGRTYLGWLVGTSVGFLLFAMVWTWILAGTLDFRPGGVLAGHITPSQGGILLGLYVIGVGKAALIPFHRWLPAAMVAPTPVSALLHAVAVVKAGVFTILKVVIFIFGFDLVNSAWSQELLLYAAATTIIIGSLIALRQDNLKRRLAYSTISQLSYIVLGALLVNSASLTGSAMHMVTHAFGKITLFFCAGAILVTTHKTKVSELSGLGRQMPITMAAFFIASISIIGLPPAAGTWSKWYLAMGTVESGQWLLLGILMVSSLLNIAYLLPIPLNAFLGSSGNNKSHYQEAPTPILLAITFTAAGCLFLFFWPDTLYQLASSIHLP